MKRTHVAVFLAVLAIILWVYFNNRQDEMYNPQKVELIEYVTGDDFDPDTFKEMMSKMTDDEDSILIAYTLAKQRDYDGLFEFVDNFFSEL
jgi:hypothetical protein